MREREARLDVRGSAIVPSLLVALVVAGCGFTRMLPKYSAVEDRERERVWGEIRSSGVDYTGPPATDHAVVPFLAFAVPYDLDIVLVSNHPEWEMHEFARVRTPDGPTWLAKDTRAANGDQMLVTSSRPLFEEMPEIPLAAQRRPVRVRNRSEGNWLDLEIRYRNFDGERVQVTYEGRKPPPVRRRNGSTMGHSRHQALAVLDLSHRSFGDRASIAIGGESYGIRRVLGIRPLQLAIRQVQGGVAEATYRYVGGHGRVTRHPRSERSEIELQWSVDRGESGIVVRQGGELRTLVYRFRRTGRGALELFEVAVEFWNAEEPIFRMRFDPALPDLRRPFAGRAQSRWVMDVGGETGQAVGRAHLKSARRSAEIRILGSEPWWVANRCTISNLEFAGERAPRVRTRVEPCNEEG